MTDQKKQVIVTFSNGTSKKIHNGTAMEVLEAFESLNPQPNTFTYFYNSETKSASGIIGNGESETFSFLTSFLG